MTSSYSRLLSVARRGYGSEAFESPLEQFSPADGRGGGACSPYHGQLEESVAICVHPSCVLSHMEACHRQDLKHIQFNHPYHSWFMPYPWGDGDTTLFHNPRTKLGPEKEETDAPPKTKTGLKSRIQEWWLANLHEDPEERDQERWDHLAKMQKRRQDYLAKKAKAIDKPVPLQPMNLILEIKYTPVNKIDSEMEN